MTPHVADFVHRPFIKERFYIVMVDKNVVLKNEFGFFHVASLEAFKRGDYILCD